MHRKFIVALVGCLFAFQLIIPPYIVLAQIDPPTRLTDIQTSNPGSGPNGFVEFNGEVYFSATDANGPGIWKTDGTTGNTIKVLDDISLASYRFFRLSVHHF